MPRIAYERWNPRGSSRALVEKINSIVDEYQAQGLDLTLRQVFYRFVSRGWLPNTVKAYKNLGGALSKARRAGLVDWDAIVDRTRYLRTFPSWPDPGALLRGAAAQYRVDPWLSQSHYVELWFEKDALAGVFERAAGPRRVPFFSCRGYASDSEVWAAAGRLVDAAARGKDTHVLYLGDHDPSGLDMTRDVRERLALFGATGVEVSRLALNMDQVEEHDPPPNPARESDSRFAEYAAEHGTESWELDALEPVTLVELVTKSLEGFVDRAAWDEAMVEEKKDRARVEAYAAKFK